MSTSIDAGVAADAAAKRVLRAAGVIWFVTAAAGQSAFVAFILAFYGTRTAAGDYPAWNDKPLIDGYVAGDGAGNAMFAAHVLLAAIVTLGGLAQMLPQIRAAAPALHRWNGRAFLVVSYAMAASGAWLVLVRGTHLSAVSGAAVLLNAVLIVVCATFAWRLALARRLDAHRRWAMRTFMVVNGVWFLRVGMMAWVILNQGQRGMTAAMSGPADIAIAFGSSLIPLAGLEAYFAAQRDPRLAAKILGAALVLAMTGVMAVGVFGTIALMWRPYL